MIVRVSKMGDYTDGYGNRTPEARHFCTKHNIHFPVERPYRGCPECEKEKKESKESEPDDKEKE